MHSPRRISIAGLNIDLCDAEAVLRELRAAYDEFARRGEEFKSDERNPHLCRAGCSHCCKSGAVFALTLAEAVELGVSMVELPEVRRRTFVLAAERLIAEQVRAFSMVGGDVDVPGRRDEALFSSRVTRLNASRPSCPLLDGDLCSVYDGRPLLCRAYGFPVDAYAVKSDETIVFRSLCVLYEGMKLREYVRAEDLKTRMAVLSRRMGGRRDWGRFTSIEAILARIEW